MLSVSDKVIEFANRTKWAEQSYEPFILSAMFRRVSINAGHGAERYIAQGRADGRLECGGLINAL